MDKLDNNKQFIFKKIKNKHNLLKETTLLMNRLKKGEGELSEVYFFAGESRTMQRNKYNKVTHLMLPKRNIAVPAGTEDLEKYFLYGIVAYIYLAVLPIKVPPYSRIRWCFHCQIDPEKHPKYIHFIDNFRKFSKMPIMVESILFDNIDVVNNLPIAFYLKDNIQDIILEAFDYKYCSRISNDELADFLIESVEPEMTTGISKELGGQKFLLYPLEWDLISTLRSVHPNEGSYVLNALKENKLNEGHFIVSGHTHIDFRPDIWRNNFLFKQFEKRYGNSRESFLVLLSPFDVISSINSYKHYKNIGQFYADLDVSTVLGAQIIIGVLEGEAVNLSVFDMREFTDEKKRKLLIEKSTNAIRELLKYNKRESYDESQILIYYDFIAENVNSDLPEDLFYLDN